MGNHQSSLADLIGAYVSAVTFHDDLAMRGNGENCGPALEAIDSALLEICRYRPASPVEEKLWRHMIMVEAVPHMEGVEDLARALVAALCDTIVELIQ